MKKAVINDEGSQAAELELKPKKFKTGSQGYYASSIIVIEGKAHRCNILLVEIGSKHG